MTFCKLRPSQSDRASFVGAALVALATSLPTAAEDQAEIQPATQSARATFKGLIIDYTGETLSIRTGPMAVVKTFPAAEVISVETEYVPAHSRGLELFTERKYREAEAQFTAALEDEERTWVRRELLASLVKCALAEDDLRKAALRFAPLVESDPQTRHWGLVPLVWDVDAVDVPSDADARTVLLAGGRAAPLIAASWNLFRKGQRSPDADAELQKLASEADVRIQRFAQMQLWRVRLATQTVTTNERRRWEATTDDLPVSMRAGAHVLIGQAAWQQKDALKAAAEWMWLPLHHPELGGLAAWSQWRAAKALEATGDSASSTLLLREIPRRFPGTKAATRAVASPSQPR